MEGGGAAPAAPSRAHCVRSEPERLLPGGPGCGRVTPYHVMLALFLEPGVGDGEDAGSQGDTGAGRRGTGQLRACPAPHPQPSCSKPTPR